MNDEMELVSPAPAAWTPKVGDRVRVAKGDFQVGLVGVLKHIDLVLSTPFTHGVLRDGSRDQTTFLFRASELEPLPPEPVQPAFPEDDLPARAQPMPALEKALADKLIARSRAGSLNEQIDQLNAKLRQHNYIPNPLEQGPGIASKIPPKPLHTRLQTSSWNPYDIWDSLEDA